MAVLPEPSLLDREKGWKIAPDYLEWIAVIVGENWDKPQWETVEAVLLAHERPATKRRGEI